MKRIPFDYTGTVQKICLLAQAFKPKTVSDPVPGKIITLVLSMVKSNLPWLSSGIEGRFFWENFV